MKLNKKQKLLLIVLISVAIGTGVAWLYYSLTIPKPITRYNFFGTELQFRDDLRVAQNISVYPDEKAILNAIWDPEIQNITIVFVDSPDNQLLAVNSFEITYKLSVGYGKFNWFINFYGKEVDTFENLRGSNENLIVALISPSLADETGVEIKDGVVYIKGKTPQEFDRATIKFIMSALNISLAL